MREDLSRCTWNIEKTDENDVLVSAPCGNAAYIVFTRLVKTKGRLPRAERYPRCRKHASAKTIAWAETKGFKVKYLDPEET